MGLTVWVLVVVLAIAILSTGFSGGGNNQEKP
jgi:hypothetical protein